MRFELIVELIGEFIMSDKVEVVWGLDMLDWVCEFVGFVSCISLNVVVWCFGYLLLIFSQMLVNKYFGDFERLVDMVCGVLMGEIVICLVLGDIGWDVCFVWQVKLCVVINVICLWVYKVCWFGCVYFRLRGVKLC